MNKAKKLAVKYESKKSLDGAMKFLKGNVKEAKKTLKKK